MAKEPTPDSTEHIFVYGTLRKGQPNSFAKDLSANAVYLGPGVMPGRLFHLGTYPGAIYMPQSKDTVLGDIYHLPSPGLLNALDDYEGLTDSDHYQRIIIPVSMQEEQLSCWVYLLRKVENYYSRITSGDWLLPV